MPVVIDPDLAAELAGFDVGEIVELFELDASEIDGGGVFLFAPAPVTDANGERVAPSFGGRVFTVIPFKSDGFRWTADGPLPTPTLRFLLAREDGDQALAATALLSVINQLDDLLGARVTRLRTLRRHLDDGEDPNPDAHLAAEIYVVERKAAQGPDSVAFELHAAIDQETVRLPLRQALGRCPLIYRVPTVDGASFDYTRATCPYAGEALFNLVGAGVTTRAADRCGKRLADCRARFGAHAELPFGGFPGIGRVQA